MDFSVTLASVTACSRTEWKALFDVPVQLMVVFFVFSLPVSALLVSMAASGTVVVAEVATVGVGSGVAPQQLCLAVLVVLAFPWIGLAADMVIPFSKVAAVVVVSVPAGREPLK